MRLFVPLEMQSMAEETAEKMGWGSGGVPAAEIAKYYIQSVESNVNGELIGPTHPV